jgi:uncharacterized phiE125 gp8 family phage protein
MHLQLVTGPSGWPIDEADLEAHARAVGQPTAQMEPYIHAASNHLEQITNRRFLSQTWKLYLDYFPSGGVISLPYAPLVSVAHIKYTDVLGVQHTFPATEYGVSIHRTPGQIILEYQKEWPTLTLRHTDPIEIQFVVGWANPSNIPNPIKQAVRMLAAHFYEHREAVMVGNAAAVDEAELPFAVSALIAPWRVWL